MKYKKRPRPGTKGHARWREKVDKQNKLRDWSLQVRERDQKCAICGSKNHLNAHHILPKEIYPEYSLELQNGISLCGGKCHKYGKFSAHKNGVWFGEWLRCKRPEQYNWVMKNMEK